MKIDVTSFDGQAAGSIEGPPDAYLGAAVAERVRLGQEKTYSLNDVAAELGLDASDL